MDVFGVKTRYEFNGSLTARALTCNGSSGSDLHFLEVERDLMEDAESDDEKSNSVNKLITNVTDEVKKLESHARPDARFPLRWCARAVRDFTRVWLWSNSRTFFSSP